MIKEFDRAGACSWLLKNGRVIDPAQNMDEQADVLILDGKIVAIGADLTDNQAQVVDCKGLWVVPGLIDVHCHLRDPGFEHKETIESGTKAAARG